jgi:uncharacterized Ntn-hydrolase superfamily protein
VTYAIVAREPKTGEFGVAVQSHYFSVGPVVPWARPGVGAVATQAMVDVSYGPRGLELMASGVSAPDALARLLAEDEHASSRQVAMVDAHGAIAAHTGDQAIPFAGHIVGEQVSCQANIMASPTVWPVMLQVFDETIGPLHRRLLSALEAAEAEGGDLRGRQSAAILVVPADGKPWDRTVELRVEDHPDPLVELRRLIEVHEAYTLAYQGDELITDGRGEEAAEKFKQALELVPDNHELQFWAGLTAVQTGNVDGGMSLIRRAIAAHSGWAALLPMIPADVAPAAPLAVEMLALEPIVQGRPEPPPS